MFSTKKQPPHTNPTPLIFQLLGNFWGFEFLLLIRILCDFFVVVFLTFFYVFSVIFVLWENRVCSTHSSFFRKFCRFWKSNIKGPFNFKVRLEGFFRASESECVSRIVWMGGGTHKVKFIACVQIHKNRTYVYTFIKGLWNIFKGKHTLERILYVYILGCV